MWENNNFFCYLNLFKNNKYLNKNNNKVVWYLQHVRIKSLKAASGYKRENGMVLFLHYL